MGIANELITRGWTRHAYEDDRGHVCLLGAAARAAGCQGIVTFDQIPNGYLLALYRAIGTETNRGGCVAEFNDTHTFDEVLRVAKEADEMLDAGLV